MADTYENTPTSLCFQHDDSDEDDIDHLRFDIVGMRLCVCSTAAPPLTRKNVTDLRDWLTAWLERTER